MILLRTLPLWLLLGCVVTEQKIDLTYGVDADDNPLFQQPVIIALDENEEGVAGDASLDAYFRSVLDQMQNAWLERDPDTLRELLEAHDHERTPGGARKRMARYRGLLRGMEFDRYVRDGSTLALQPPREGDGAVPEDNDRVPLGAPARFVLRLGDTPLPTGVEDLAMWGVGGAHPTKVQLTLRVRDTDPSGDVTRIVRRMVVPLGTDHPFVKGPARQPFELNLPAGNAAFREIDIEAAVVPGFVRYEDFAVPHQRVPIFEQSFVFYPARIGLVEKQPARWLAEAMRIGDSQRFRDVLLAVRFLPEGGRDKAIVDLMEWVRFGLGDQPKVAMAALEMLTGNRRPGRRREAWLQWFKEWNQQRTKR